jgi:hypothetical protein
MGEIQRRATEFLLICSKSGLAHSFDERTGRWVKPYPEVTGYLLSYLSQKNLEGAYDSHITRMTNALIRKQHPCGGWKSFQGPGVIFFDTAQIIKGLFDTGRWKSDLKIRNSIKKGLRFLSSQITSSGMIFPTFSPILNAMSSKTNSWSDGFSGINTKVLELFHSQGIEMLDPEIIELRELVLEWSLNLPQIEFSHPGAYQLEGLIAAGKHDLVADRIRSFFIPTLKPNGFLPYRYDLDYAYTSGSAQMGILMAKVGYMQEAQAIYKYLNDVISSSSKGGLIQYTNEDGSISKLIHTESNSWGTKYFLELSHAII